MWRSVLLPEPRGAHDRDHLARFDPEVHAVERAYLGPSLPVVHVEGVRFDRRRVHESHGMAGARPCDPYFASV
jgi:hypothetical protein